MEVLPGKVDGVEAAEKMFQRTLGIFEDIQLQHSGASWLSVPINVANKTATRNHLGTTTLVWPDSIIINYH